MTCILPVLPFPLSLELTAHPSCHALLQGRILCHPGGPQVSLGLHLAAITAHSSQPGWMQVWDFGSSSPSARLLVLRPARGPEQDPPSPNLHWDWPVSIEGQPSVSHP
jgi:hypothetical protein